MHAQMVVVEIAVEEGGSLGVWGRQGGTREVGRDKRSTEDKRSVRVRAHTHTHKHTRAE